ncbi:MAG: hypothetical protein VB102_05245 [Paludibacter sp.]|nr:hypothetical protein [Paludibacter sp.]
MKKMYSLQFGKEINSVQKFLSVFVFAVIIAGTMNVSMAQSVTSKSSWQSFNVSTQTGSFRVQFDLVMSLANTQGYVTVQNGTITDTPQGACIIYVHQSGVIWARNGSSYTSNGTVRFTAGTSYHFRLEINVPTHTYSIYVTPSGQSEITLGANYAFRTEQASVTQLTGWGLRSEALAGSYMTVSNMTFVSDLTAPTVPSGLSAGNITQNAFDLNWEPSTDNVGVTGYEVFKDGVSIGTTTSTTMSVTGLSSETVYAMTVRARDAVGNWSAQSSAYNVTTQGISTGVNVAEMTDVPNMLIYSDESGIGKKVKFLVPSASIVTLNVYNVDGKEITVLVDEVKSAGEYTLEWNTSELLPGIYIMRMTVLPTGTNKSITFHKKIVIAE